MKLLERHYTFIGLIIVVVGAMLMGINPDVTPSPDSQRMFAYLDSLPEGSYLMVSFDHEASSLPEMKPLAVAMLRHSFSRGHKLIGIALLAEGTGVGYGVMREIAAEQGKTYGVDYVYLGFKPQFVAAILAMGESIKATFPEDYLGRAYGDLPMMTGVRNYDDLAGVISLADGSLTTHWIEYGRGSFSVTVSAFVAAAMVTTYDPYLASGQMHAIVGGLRGAAEYEKLIGHGGSGLRGMLAQSGAHLYVILLILLGNVIYFMRKRQGRG